MQFREVRLAAEHVTNGACVSDRIPDKRFHLQGFVVIAAEKTFTHCVRFIYSR